MLFFSEDFHAPRGDSCSVEHAAPTSLVTSGERQLGIDWDSFCMKIIQFLKPWQIPSPSTVWP